MMIVLASAMKNLVKTSLYGNSSLDYRALAKAALICRREIASHRNDNNHKLTVEKHGFKGQCQETSVPDGLKFLVGMITREPSSEETVTETQATLSLLNLSSSILQRKRQMPIAQRHHCRYILDSKFIQGSGAAKWWMS